MATLSDMVLESLFEQQMKADYDRAHRKIWTDKQARDSMSQARWLVEQVAAWHTRNAPTVITASADSPLAERS